MSSLLFTFRIVARTRGSGHAPRQMRTLFACKGRAERHRIRVVTAWALPRHCLHRLGVSRPCLTPPRDCGRAAVGSRSNCDLHGPDVVELRSRRSQLVRPAFLGIGATTTDVPSCSLRHCIRFVTVPSCSVTAMLRIARAPPRFRNRIGTAAAASPLRLRLAKLVATRLYLGSPLTGSCLATPGAVHRRRALLAQAHGPWQSPR